MNIKLLSLSLATLALGSGMTMATSQTFAKSELPALSVYGEAEIEKQADYAKVFGYIEKISDDKEDIDEIVENFSTIKANLAEVGIEENKVQSLYFYDSVCNFEGSVAYRGYLDFFVICDDLSQMKSIVSTIIEDGKISNITYELKDTSIYNEALSMATENAMQKANSLLKTDNMEVTHIEEQCFFHCPSNYKDFVEVENDDYIETITVKARVKVSMAVVENNGDNVDKETGEILDNEVLDSQEFTQENIDKETGELLLPSLEEPLLSQENPANKIQE